jgi:hypothetical protein
MKGYGLGWLGWPQEKERRERWAAAGLEEKGNG